MKTLTSTQALVDAQTNPVSLNKKKNMIYKKKTYILHVQCTHKLKWTYI